MSSALARLGSARESPQVALASILGSVTTTTLSARAHRGADVIGALRRVRRRRPGPPHPRRLGRRRGRASRSLAWRGRRALGDKAPNARRHRRASSRPPVSTPQRSSALDAGQEPTDDALDRRAHDVGDGRRGSKSRRGVPVALGSRAFARRRGTGRARRRSRPGARSRRCGRGRVALAARETDGPLGDLGGVEGAHEWQECVRPRRRSRPLRLARRSWRPCDEVKTVPLVPKEIATSPGASPSASAAPMLSPVPGPTSAPRTERRARDRPRRCGPRMSGSHSSRRAHQRQQSLVDRRRNSVTTSRFPKRHHGHRRPRSGRPKSCHVSHS